MSSGFQGWTKSVDWWLRHRLWSTILHMWLSLWKWMILIWQNYKYSSERWGILTHHYLWSRWAGISSVSSQIKELDWTKREMCAASKKW
jgi:hypothetical protein